MFIRFFILGLLFLLSGVYVFAYSDDEISFLEQNQYGQSFESDSLAQRLNRLETDLFGMAQSGDIDSRLDMLFKLSNNSKASAIVTPDYNYYSVSEPKKANAFKNFWNNFTEPFSQGVVTGYTPPINYSSSFSSYGNDFMNFLNNPQQYCPYHNTYHNNNHYHNYNNLGNNKFLNRPYHNTINKNGRYYNSKFRPKRNYRMTHNNFSPYNPFGSPSSMPTTGYMNVSTGSSVHILRD